MQQLRLQEACRLLLGTAMSIKEIAFRLNYGDASYFSNMFRRNLGMTPLEYRNRFGVGITWETDPGNIEQAEP